MNLEPDIYPLETTKPIATTALVQSEWGSLLSLPHQPAIISTNPPDSTLFDNEQQRAVPSSVLSPSWPIDPSLGTMMGVNPTLDWNEADLSLPEPSPSGETYSLSGLCQGESSATTSSGAKAASSEPGSRKTTHDCEAQAVSILRSLQNNEMSEGATSCTTTRYSDLNLSPSFDGVLATNKLALNSWKRLMECTCAECPHLILLYVAILSKMLFWYYIIAEKSLSTGGSGQDSAGDSIIVDTPTHGPPKIREFDVLPTKVQVGLLDIDPEDQAIMRRAVLLRELRAMEQAIAEFSDQINPAEGVEPHYIAQRSKKWSLTSISFIKEELDTVIRKVEQP
ncbi:unnamed protein product [Clonostachys byssicola]|uniref:Aflatoxin regulatory protein domain-containing protein n=1 Tax=Clonostachys byssicola TaxID=160290 RepID=A0A9N9U753_9HYPO|nr:unnamed protein product [Clonostachys byssicola]